MKRKTTFLTKAFLMLFAMFCSFTAARADFVNIGSADGAAGNTYLPMNSLYDNSYTQQIYTVEEIGMPGTINSITLWLYNGNSSNVLPGFAYDIYMVETDKEGFESATDWVQVTAADIVASGTIEVTNTEAKPFTFELTTPFKYSGGGNLVVCFNASNVGEYKSGLTGAVFGETTDPAGAIYARKDGAVYDPTDMSSVQGSFTYLRNVIEISIEPGSGTIFRRPANLTVSDLTDQSATIAWTAPEGSPTGYVYQYKKTAEEEWSTEATTTETSVALSGLTQGTPYVFQVKAVYSEGESGFAKVNFKTEFGAFSLPYDEGFENGIGAWTLTACAASTGITTDSKRNGSYGFKFNYNTTPPQYLISPLLDVPASGVDVTFYYKNPGTYTETFMVGYSTTTTEPEAFTWGDEITAITSSTEWEEYNAVLPGGTKYVAIAYTANDQLKLFIDDFHFAAASSVAKPTGLKVSYEGGTEATISWASEESDFDIEVNGKVTEGVENPCTLTGLEFATEYTVRVRAKNGTEYSDWSTPVTFSTDLSDDMCQIQLLAMDSYGDGWSGSKITITDVESGIVIGTYTLTSAAGQDVQTFVIDVPNNRDIQFTWTSNSSWDSEAIYAAYDINEVEIFSGSGGFTEPIIWRVDCKVTPWRVPSNVAATEVGPYSAKLSWTENSTTPATSWVIAYKEEGAQDSIAVTVDTNPYVLEGLTPNVTYTVKVRPNTDEVEKWSDEITFTTYFAAPTELAAEPTSTTAEITWNGDAHAKDFTLRYAEVPTTVVTTTLSYDNDTYGGGIGNSSAYTWTWGVMYPGSMVNGNVLTKVSLFESTTNTADITINIYQGGDTAPGTLLYTETITPEAANAFHEVTLATPVEITPGENLWITLTEYGTYVITYCSSTEPNNQWVDGSGNGDWANIGDLSESLAGDGWMIRAEITSIDYSSLVWTVVEGVTSPTELVGLTPETEYIVQVKTTYEDGESDWASANFTTLESFPTPTNLAVSDITNRTAALSWNENGTATAWQICLNDDEEKLIEADANPFTLTGLTPETAYTAKVRAIDGEKTTKWSEAISFTTDIACPAPTELAASDVTSSSATITWQGFADSYNLAYREYVAGGDVVTDFDDSSLGEWTTIDADGDGYGWILGSAAGGVYLQEGGSLAGTGNGGSADLVTSGSYSNVEGALTPDNYLVSPRVTLGGTITFYACAQDASYAAEYFGVAVSTTSNSDPAAFTMVEEWTMNSDGTGSKSSRRNAQGTWGLFTVDLSAYAGQEGYVAIRHFNCTDQFLLNVDDITISQPSEEEKPWTEVANATNPYTIEGLETETKYEVRVQGVYADGTSQWTSTTFTTTVDNPVPTNIVADLVADGANLTWEGEGESYNVRYRVAATTGDAIFEEEFENLDQWTVVTAGEGTGWNIEDGSAVAYSYDNSTLTPWNADNWLISPEVNLGGILKFYVGTAAAYPDSYEVLLSTTGTETTDFTVELQAMAIAETGNVTIDLSAYAGQTGHIAIHHVSYDSFILFVDNFGIYELIPASEWTEFAAEETTATISGLATNNLYEYEVQSVKGDNTSEWSEAQDFVLLTFDSNGDYNDVINEYNGKQAHVTLNRTFAANDTWHTFYLPFDLTDDQFGMSALGEGEVRAFVSSTVEGESATLNFATAEQTSGIFGQPGYLGGVPYIIKWASGSDIVNPEFANVTITNEKYFTGDSQGDVQIRFVGTYAKETFTQDDTSILFIGADNKLNYPLAGATIGAFRGYFELIGVTANIKQFNLNLDDEDPTAIAGVESANENGDWYDISGRKLAGKPGMKGIYVNGGRKVTVK